MEVRSNLAPYRRGPAAAEVLFVKGTKSGGGVAWGDREPKAEGGKGAAANSPLYPTLHS